MESKVGKKKKKITDEVIRGQKRKVPAGWCYACHGSFALGSGSGRESRWRLEGVGGEGEARRVLFCCCEESLVRHSLALHKRELERIPAKVILDGLKRNMSRGNSLSDELEISSVLGDTRAYLYSPVWG